MRIRVLTAGLAALAVCSSALAWEPTKPVEIVQEIVVRLGRGTKGDRPPGGAVVVVGARHV